MSLPPRIVTLLQQGLAHHQAGRLDAAAKLYEQVRRAAPRHFDALHLPGVLAYQQRRYEDAERLLTEAVKVNPSSAVADMRLGMVLVARNQFEAAATRLRRVAKRAGAPPETWLHLARALRGLGRTSDALPVAQEAVKRLPKSADAHRILAGLIADAEGFAAAAPVLAKVTELVPDDPLNWSDLGIALAWVGRIEESETALRRALGLDPSQVQARVGLGFAFQQAHRIPEALEAYTQALALDPSHRQAQSARLLCMHYLDNVPREEVFRVHREFGQTHAAATSPRQAGRPLADRRLRVAFLSADFRRHSVAYFIEPLLQHLDRTQFEVILYHDHHQVDGMSERLKRLADHWHNFGGGPADAVEARIVADAPDILVELGGHTGFNRLPLLARRPAPVQVTYLGYPDTTGLETMDFRLVDAITDPEGEADAYHTERLIRFAPTAWAYRAPEEAPEVPPLPCFAGDAFTFGSFNTFSKISDDTLRLWSRVLASVPDSRLLLKGHGLDDTYVQRHLHERMERCGLDLQRVELLGRTRSMADHLALYGRVDIALDPLPYSGTTTTCEALWMGRPVITLAGDRHASRVSASLLQAIGRPEWIASNPEHYVAIVSALATDRNAFAAANASLREAVRHSPLGDHAGQARRFGDALLACWQQSCAKGKVVAA